MVVRIVVVALIFVAIGLGTFYRYWIERVMLDAEEKRRRTERHERRMERDAIAQTEGPCQLDDIALARDPLDESCCYADCVAGGGQHDADCKNAPAFGGTSADVETPL